MAPQSAISSQYRAIRNNLRSEFNGKKLKTFVMTSSFANEGKTTTAVNLAISIAQRGEKVLIIDANHKSPAIHDVFNINSTPGLTNVLARQSTLKESIVSAKISKLDILPLGTLLYNATELLDSSVMDDVLHIVSQQYDVIIVDSAPVLEAMDTNTLANKCDGVVLVVEARKTKSEAVQKAKRQLEFFAKATIVGVILNKKEAN